jgi:hypothetical protein
MPVRFDGPGADSCRFPRVEPRERCLNGWGPCGREARPSEDEEVFQLVASLLAQADGGGVGTILWIIAAVLVIAGIVNIVRGGIIVGIVLIVLGLLVGPGGVSIFG